jgi:hypothetical protein
MFCRTHPVSRSVMMQAVFSNSTNQRRQNKWRDSMRPVSIQTTHCALLEPDDFSQPPTDWTLYENVNRDLRLPSMTPWRGAYPAFQRTRTIVVSCHVQKVSSCMDQCTKKEYRNKRWFLWLLSVNRSFRQVIGNPVGYNGAAGGMTNFQEKIPTSRRRSPREDPIQKPPRKNNWKRREKRESNWLATMNTVRIQQCNTS